MTAAAAAIAAFSTFRKLKQITIRVLGLRKNTLQRAVSLGQHGFSVNDLLRILKAIQATQLPSRTEIAIPLPKYRAVFQ